VTCRHPFLTVERCWREKKKAGSTSRSAGGARRGAGSALVPVKEPLQDTGWIIRHIDTNTEFKLEWDVSPSNKNALTPTSAGYPLIVRENYNLVCRKPVPAGQCLLELNKYDDEPKRVNYRLMTVGEYRLNTICELNLFEAMTEIALEELEWQWDCTVNVQPDKHGLSFKKGFIENLCEVNHDTAKKRLEELLLDAGVGTQCFEVIVHETPGVESEVGDVNDPTGRTEGRKTLQCC
jgi:hypothetical protein